MQVSQETGKNLVSHLLKNFPQFVVIHTDKGFCIVKEAEVDFFFFNSLAFSRHVRLKSKGVQKLNLNTGN